MESSSQKELDDVLERSESVSESDGSESSRATNDNSEKQKVPVRKLKLQILTFNVACREAAVDVVEKLFTFEDEDAPHLIVIGFQEMSAGPISRMSGMVTWDSWTTLITQTLGKRRFVRVNELRLVGIVTLIFCRREMLANLQRIQATWLRTGFWGYWGNKGALAHHVTICGVEIAFVNAHLTPHREFLQKRLEEQAAILKLNLNGGREGGAEKDGGGDDRLLTIEQHDYSFLFGDLNFRLDDLTFDEIQIRLVKGDLASLLAHDQLLKSRKEGAAFVGWNEADLNFPPTYKFNPSSDVYDTSSKRRAPGWTDRVLYKCCPDNFSLPGALSMQLTSYRSLPLVSESDHRPVTAEFIIQAFDDEQPLVNFETVSDIVSGADLHFAYVVHVQIVDEDSADWVGIYPAEMNSLDKYVYYTWTPRWQDGAGDNDDDWLKVMSTIPSLTVATAVGTKFVLVYMSASRGCPLGMSNVFEVTTPQP